MWRAPGLADGEVLAGRFRILRFIARGGVALKTIRPDVAGDERTVVRARVEKDAAARGFRWIARRAAQASAR